METSPETVEYLKLGELVSKMPRKVGGKAFLVPRLFIEKIRNKWKRMKSSLENFAGGELINKQIEKKEEKIEKKIDAWEEYRDEVREGLKESISNKDTKSTNNAVAALSYSRMKIEELKKKKIKVNKKGLGVFALSALSLKKIASDSFYKIKTKIDEIKEKAKEEREAKKSAKAEDKAIKEYDKKTKKSKTSGKEIVSLLKQICEQLKVQNDLKRQEMAIIYGFSNKEDEEKRTAPTTIK